MERLKSGIEQYPEYKEYVAKHQAELDKKLEEAKKTLDEKTQEYGVTKSFRSMVRQSKEVGNSLPGLST